MNIIIDREGNVGFDDWFWESDAEPMLEALKVIRTDISIIRSDDRFKDKPILFRKKRYGEIPRTPKNVKIILDNLHRSDQEVLDLLGYGNRDSTFIITTLSRTLEREFLKWEKIDNTQNWQNRSEAIAAFAKQYSQIGGN